MANIRRPEPINPNVLPPSLPTNQWRVPEDIRSIGYCFGALILGSAVVYFVGSQYGWGIKPTFQEGIGEHAITPTVTFWDCLHFSVVTIATLGYGDYRPESHGRVVAAIEVVSGIVLMGVLVSRLVSRQQERLSLRLMKGISNLEFRSFRDRLSSAIGTLKAVKAGATSVNHEKGASFWDALENISPLSQAIARYVRFESTHLDFSEYVQTRSLGRLLGDLRELLSILADATESRQANEIGEQNRNLIRNVTESCLATTTVIDDLLVEDGIRHIADKIYALVLELRDRFQLSRFHLPRSPQSTQ